MVLFIKIITFLGDFTVASLPKTKGRGL